MATKSLSQFKTELAGGGARPNLFEVEIPAFPAAIDTVDWNSDAQNTFKFLCKAAQLPASNSCPYQYSFQR